TRLAEASATEATRAAHASLPPLCSRRWRPVKRHAPPGGTRRGTRRATLTFSYAVLIRRLQLSTELRRSCGDDQSDTASALDHESSRLLRRANPGQPGRLARPADEHQAAQAPAI